MAEYRAQTGGDWAVYARAVVLLSRASAQCKPARRQGSSDVAYPQKIPSRMGGTAPAAPFFQALSTRAEDKVPVDEVIGLSEF